MKNRQLVDIVLETVLEGLAKDAQEAIKTKERDVTASGHIDFLVKKLAETFLTKQQQKQVQAILDLYDQCLFPLACSRTPQRQLCSWCPEEERNEGGNDFFGEPCQINGVPCCEVCATVDKLLT